MLKDSLDAILSYVSRIPLTYRGYEITTMPRVRNLSKVEVLGQANLCCFFSEETGGLEQRRGNRIQQKLVIKNYSCEYLQCISW